MPETAYVLGHGASEVRRLELQGRLLAPGTEQTLRAAGLGPGMRVLDIGTGAGDVAMIAAGLVGPSGAVLGIDREASVLERARARAGAAGLAHLRCEAATLDTLPAGQRFDAVVGRYVLHHQGDRVAFLRRAAERVRPGGTLAFMEPTLLTRAAGSEPWSNPFVPLFDEARDLYVAAYERAGVHVRTGVELVPLFREAGLPEPALLQAVPTMGPTSEAVELMCLIVRSLLPTMERHGVTTAEAVGIDTLQARMQAAVSEAHSQLRVANLVGAWARIG